MVRVGLISILLTMAASPVWCAEVVVSGGTIRGTELPDGSTVFFGIPYAAPPTGSLRWRPPQPVVPWSGVRDATQPPRPCIQHDEGWNSKDALAGQEDCLYLSIHAPKHPANAHLPVIFWIHGGSNRAGSGYGYVDSAIHRYGVVLVALEYRLGVFGFLSSPELSAESAQHASGNYAILDQIAALEWVKHNIAVFGGDPDSVTVAGQSAGSFDVGMLLLSPLARGLFKQAIMESGTPGLALPPRSLADNETTGVQLETALHLPGGADGLAGLRSEPAAALIAPGDQLQPPGLPDPGVLWGQAIVDGWVLPRAPRAIFASGQQAHVPLIIGNNTREFSLPGGDNAARAMINGVFGTRAPDVLAGYGLTGASAPAPDPVLGDAAAQFVTDWVFRCPANDIARFQAQAGVPVWRYEFGVAALDAHGVVAHSAELKYIFDPPPAGATVRSWPPVQEYWAQFAKTGNPNGAGLPRWPALGRHLEYLSFTPQGPEVGRDLRGAVCGKLSNHAP
jgi:para-nitrobenzyl esterase